MGQFRFVKDPFNRIFDCRLNNSYKYSQDFSSYNGNFSNSFTMHAGCSNLGPFIIIFNLQVNQKLCF